MSKQDVGVTLINTMMEMCGYNARIEHLRTMSKMGVSWYHEYTCTPEEAKRFENFAIPLIRKKYKLSLCKAKQEFGWFWLCYGLREIGTEIVANKA